MNKKTKPSSHKNRSLIRKVASFVVIIALLFIGYKLITGRNTGLLTQESLISCHSPAVSDFTWQNKNAFYDQVSFLLIPQQKLENWADLEKAQKYVQIRVNNKYAASTYTDIKPVRDIDNGFLVTLDTKKIKSGAKQKIDVTAINQLTKARMCLTEKEYIVSSIGEVEEITMLAEQDKELDKFPEIALADRIYYPAACKRQHFLDVPRSHKSSFQINKAVCEGFMFGDERTKSFRVDEPATRAELIRSALLVADIFPSEIVPKQPYVDVLVTSEFASYIQKAKEMRIIYSMRPDKKLQPDKYVSRLESISVLVNLLGADLDEITAEDFYTSGFQDVFPDMDFSKEIIWALKNGLLPAQAKVDVTNRFFHPNDPLIREQLAKWLVNAMEVISQKQRRL